MRTISFFFGGGGGSGDANSSTATAGANGGGIVMIFANAVVGNGNKIKVNGGNVAAVANSDGAGGGGAAGTVVLDIQNYNTALSIETIGGDGGNVDNALDPDSCFGPGGGGSGGFIWHAGGSLPASVSMSQAGGQSGSTVNGNANAACAGSSNGAALGQPGGSLNGLQIPESNTVYAALSGSASVNIDTICEGQSVILSASGTGTGGVTYNWSNGAAGSTVNASPADNTTYSVTITDNRGCGVVDNSVQVVVESATVQANAVPDVILQGDSTSLAAEGQAGYTYSWVPSADLNNANIASPTATPTVTTTYCVTAISDFGCIDTACTTVVVNEPVEPEPPKVLEIPTAFSPNNDGVNDEFTILYSSTVQIEILEMKIFNRWGNIVHDSPEPWDGKRKDNRDPMPLNTYIYKISYRDLENGEITKVSGNVTLVH